MIMSSKNGTLKKGPFVEQEKGKRKVQNRKRKKTRKVHREKAEIIKFTEKAEGTKFSSTSEGEVQTLRTKSHAGSESDLSKKKGPAVAKKISENVKKDILFLTRIQPPPPRCHSQKEESSKKRVKPKRLSSSCTSLDQLAKSKSGTSLESLQSRTSLISLSKSHSSNKSLEKINESLRWEYALEDPIEEEERIKIYKINRRKRYLAASNKKYANWMSGSESNSSLGSKSVPHMGNKSIKQTKRQLPDIVTSSVTKVSLKKECSRHAQSVGQMAQCAV